MSTDLRYEARQWGARGKVSESGLAMAMWGVRGGAARGAYIYIYICIHLCVCVYSYRYTVS